MRRPRATAADLGRAAAVLAALYLTAGLLWLLPSPGYTTTRLALFAVILAFGWLGAAGAVVGRPVGAAVGTVGLFLLGFWQAVLWVFVLPAAAVLAVAAALAHPAGDDPDGDGRDGATSG